MIAAPSWGKGISPLKHENQLSCPDAWRYLPLILDVSHGPYRLQGNLGITTTHLESSCVVCKIHAQEVPQNNPCFYLSPRERNGQAVWQGTAGLSGCVLQFTGGKVGSCHCYRLAINFTMQTHGSHDLRMRHCVTTMVTLKLLCQLCWPVVGTGGGVCLIRKDPQAWAFQ